MSEWVKSCGFVKLYMCRSLERRWKYVFSFCKCVLITFLYMCSIQAQIGRLSENFTLILMPYWCQRVPGTQFIPQAPCSLLLTGGFICILSASFQASRQIGNYLESAEFNQTSLQRGKVTTFVMKRRHKRDPNQVRLLLNTRFNFCVW